MLCVTVFLLSSGGSSKSLLNRSRSSSRVPPSLLQATYLPEAKLSIFWKYMNRKKTALDSARAAIDTSRDHNSTLNTDDKSSSPVFSHDRFYLQRFVDAQTDDLYAEVIDELTLGRKRSHWMWFIFPQKKGIYPSQMSRYYGITSEDEARAYLKHPVLGPRLVECTRIVLATERKSLRGIFGSPDDVKFLRCMELFCSIPSEHQRTFARGLSLR